eukprot:TRINITY_DN1843_c0_g1_i2.p1 TRINITY_DN1843_c0_g1~~TRINITY_DN1843_c0_g1_i2.p1  ORF type:complete len:151 (-),score=21.44 TRINITY_DN1843_c0_g1_i2:525-926(-)
MAAPWCDSALSGLNSLAFGKRCVFAILAGAVAANGVWQRDASREFVQVTADWQSKQDSTSSPQPLLSGDSVVLIAHDGRSLGVFGNGDVRARQIPEAHRFKIYSEGAVGQPIVAGNVAVPAPLFCIKGGFSRI